MSQHTQVHCHMTVWRLRIHSLWLLLLRCFFFFFFNDTATTEIYTLSLHDALPIYGNYFDGKERRPRRIHHRKSRRSEEHTSELQSPCNLVCRLLLEKKKKKIT